MSPKGPVMNGQHIFAGQLRLETRWETNGFFILKIRINSKKVGEF
jgi:hypothetical protein